MYSIIKKNISYFCAISFASVFLFSCKSSSTQETTKTEINDSIVTLTDAQLKNAGIETISLQQKNISTALKINGLIEVPPQNLVSISCPMGGYLKDTKLLPGMHISKGEIIATIEDQQFIQLQQDYLLAKSKIHYAETEYNRQKELNETQSSSNKVMQQAETEFKNATILLASLSEKLKLININPNKITPANISKSIFLYAPIDGFITKVNVNIGKYVSPTEILFDAVNPSDIHLNLKVFEKDVATLAIGKKVIAYTNANPTKKYECEIVLISKDVSKEGTVDVHCHFESYDKTLLPGMYMNAEIEITNTLGNTLPDESVVSYEGDNYVFVVKDKHTYALQKVSVLNTNNNLVQISTDDANNLSGKLIITKGAYTLLMKMKMVNDNE